VVDARVDRPRTAPVRSAIAENLAAGRPLLRAALKAALQYRASFVSTMMGGIVLQGTQLLFIGVLLAQFHVIHGWGFREIALVYAIRLAAHACYVVPFGNLLQIDVLVRQGDIDRMLLRPANLWLQIVFSRFPLMALGDALLGFGALIVFSVTAPIDWTPLKVGYLILAVLSGGLVETGVQTGLSGLAFPFSSTASIRIMADDLLTRFSGYPLTMFGRPGLWSLTFVYPMAFIAFLPGAVLLGQVRTIPLPIWLCWGAPAAGPIVFGLGYAFFARMTRSYSSPGN